MVNLTAAQLEENMELIFGLLPEGWEQKAKELKAFQKPLAGFPSVSHLFRTLLMHFCGLSLKETALRVNELGFGSISAPGLYKRLKAAEGWLGWMALELFGQSSEPCPQINRRIRLVDATVIKEQGKTGSCWRVHWSMNLETLDCDFFELTGQQEGETLRRFPLKPGDLAVADALYASPPSFAYAKQCGADLLVRLRKDGQWLLGENGKPLDLLKQLGTIKQKNKPVEWSVQIKLKDQTTAPARIIAVKLEDAAHQKSLKKGKRKAQKSQYKFSSKAEEMRQYFVVITTMPEAEMSREMGVSIYRRRWQIELGFKRQKTILDMGCIPKSNSQSVKAWLYGKLILGMLINRFKEKAEFFLIGKSEGEQNQGLQSVA